MAEFLPQPSEDLIEKGEAWARGQFLFENRNSINYFLEGAFRGGQRIFDVHRGEMQDEIEDNGGLERVEYVYRGDYLNAVLCKNGKSILASDLFCRRFEVQDLPPGDSLPAGAQQKFAILMSYGGPSLGVKSEAVVEADRSEFNRPNLELFFDPEFYPEETAVTEVVMTTFNSSGSDRKEDFQERHYSVFAETWNARLRPDFGGHTDDPGLSVTDLIFTATGTLTDPWQKWETYQGMKTFVDRYGSITDKEEAAAKLLRFHELIRYCHREVAGEDLGASVLHEGQLGQGAVLPIGAKTDSGNGQ